MPRLLMDTVARIPAGAIVDLGDRAPVLLAVVSDPWPGQPHRLRLDLDDGVPEWRQPGEILRYGMPPTEAEIAAWWAARDALATEAHSIQQTTTEQENPR